MVIQVFINFYGEIYIVILFLKTASKKFMPGNLGLILFPSNKCHIPILILHETPTDYSHYTLKLIIISTFCTDAESDSTSECLLNVYVEAKSVNFDQHMHASQLPMSPTCE